MADKRGLQSIGIIYGGFTAVVALIAFLVVSDHISGQLTLDSTPTDISSLAR